VHLFGFIIRKQGNENKNRRSVLLTLCVFFVNVSRNMGQKAVGAVSNTFGANALLPQYYRHNDHIPGSSTFFGYVNVFLISNFHRVLNVVHFLLGNSPASEFYMPTFRNTLSVHTYSLMKKKQTQRSETSVYKIQTPGNYPVESTQQVKVCL